MCKERNTHPSAAEEKEFFFFKTKTILVILEVSFVAALFVLWFGSESFRKSHNIWILFLFAFPANFLAAVVPYDPTIIYFGKFYPPLSVTLIGVAGVVVVEGVNYSILRFISESKLLVKVEHNKFIKKIIDLFGKAPFAALCLAGFLPIPFYPFRFLVALSRYPFIKYLLSVFLSKAPRIFILALAGYVINIPDHLFFFFFIALIMIMYFLFVLNQLRERREKSRKPRL